MRILRIALWALGIIVLGLLILFAWLELRSPAMRPPVTETIAPTPERLARGRYLAEVVCDCLGCHSDRRVDRFALPIVPGTLGQGGFTFDESLGIPGRVSAQNITSDREYGKGAWSDGELMRAIREGVSRDGHALFPMMPYRSYRQLSDEDVKAIVVFLRTLPPIKKPTPPVQLNFPINLFVKLEPRPVEAPIATPRPSDGLAYGKYLTTIAGCGVCHTQQAQGREIPSLAFAGGFIFPGPWGRVVSANITPDPETGIGALSREAFIGRFKAFANLDEAPVAAPGRNTVMNWLDYAKMSEQDLGAIYDYLRTLPPIKNKVNPFPDAR